LAPITANLPKTGFGALSAGLSSQLSASECACGLPQAASGQPTSVPESRFRAGVAELLGDALTLMMGGFDRLRRDRAELHSIHANLLARERLEQVQTGFHPDLYRW
jgi:hypothetical protein